MFSGNFKEVGDLGEELGRWQEMAREREPLTIISVEEGVEYPYKVRVAKNGEHSIGTTFCSEELQYLSLKDMLGKLI